jgi:hypothetical protein
MDIIAALKQEELVAATEERGYKACANGGTNKASVTCVKLNKWYERQENDVCRGSSQNFPNGESPMGQDQG